MIFDEFKRRIAHEHPLFGLSLCLCPALAVTTTVFNALGLGLMVLFVVTASNTLLALIRRWVPEKIRLLCCITVIATMVTIADLFIKTRFPVLSSHLGMYGALIATNCMILERTQTFALHNKSFKSFIDGFILGLKFFISLTIIALLREFLGANTLFGLTVIPGYKPMGALIMAPGAFFMIAALMGIVNYRRLIKERRKR